ncbi:MAG TPA: glycoside hydrolase family 30 beta sandwich domain-containing protein [Terracidiphilus sp.]|nr:glycoside hydrolase family 30 beta sandwich domain-containing protein [Terracidiphilus sp.]
MQNTSRRRFLLRSSALAALAAFDGFPAIAQSSHRASPLAWITAGDRRFAPLAVDSWTPSANPAPGAVTVDPSRRFQSILGFGGAFTDASCYLFGQMPEAARHQLLEELCGPSGLRLSVGRTCIGSSDYSRTAYSFDDAPAPDPALTHFSIHHDRAYILPTLREARSVNPEMFLFSAPWSPPGWMKSNNSLLGGTMQNKYLAAYAQYFVKFLQGYKQAGVPIDAVTSQNEVDTNQDGRMPACLWGQEYEMGFVRDHLGPALRTAGIDTKIWILDHNYSLWGRVLDELSDPELAQFVDGVAWHGYVGAPDAMTRVHNAYPSKGMYWTEGGPDITDPKYSTDWAMWSNTFSGILNNWARCIVSWNLLLDEHGKPNIGPFSCGGVVTLNSKTGEITRSGQYWAFAHYAKLVRRGARVLASSGGAFGIAHTAFLNPDGSYVLVLTNQGEQRAVECRIQDNALQVTLPRDSIVTLQWSDPEPS